MHAATGMHHQAGMQARTYERMYQQQTKSMQASNLSGSSVTQACSPACMQPSLPYYHLVSGQQ
jgi:hypothetical protein